MLSLKRRENFLIKYRHDIKYLPIFLFVLISLLHISSTNPEISETDNLLYPPKINDTIYVYDTVVYYDTTYVYDTVYSSKIIRDTVEIITMYPVYSNIKYKDSVKYSFFNRGHQFFPLNRYIFSADIFFSPLYSLHNFSSDPIYSDALQLNKTSVKPLLSNTFGLGINFHRRSSVFSSGLLYTTIRENYNFLATDYLIDTVLAYRYFTETVMQIDSVPFINIDTLLATGDTVYYFIIDTNYITTLDSNLISKTDTVENKYNDKSDNSYTFIEIPLIYSFTFYRPNFTISPEIGIITSFFVNSKGKIVSLANLNQSNKLENESKFAFVNISLYTGLKLTYFINEKFNLFTAAFYRKSINSIYIDYPIISKFDSFGFNFGLRYKILL
ncbi:MAG: hypothetical protein K8R54_07720 [Bacteroidales bacterium]|nr:hypothetical protein [Bacteroidales bacterium]